MIFISVNIAVLIRRTRPPAGDTPVGSGHPDSGHESDPSAGQETAAWVIIPAMFKNRILSSTLFVIALIGLGAFFGIYTSEYYQRNQDPGIQGLLWPNPKQLRPFATIDQDNQVFGLDRLQGKWSFLFFGYTHCPDICPLTMSSLNQAWKILEQKGKADPAQVVFVSVDPQRDTSQLLKEYVRYFNPEFIGLGGTMTQVDSLARQIGIAYMHREKDERGDYLVDHSGSIFLIDPEGRLLAVLQGPHEPRAIVDRFLDIKHFYERKS